MSDSTWYTTDGSYVRTRTVGDAMLVRVARDEGNSAELTDAEAVRLARWLLRNSLPRADWLHVAGAIATTKWQANEDKLLIDEAREAAAEEQLERYYEEREHWAEAQSDNHP